MEGELLASACYLCKMSAAKHHTVRIAGQNLQLHPFRCIYWEEEEVLLIADLHLGKAQHFRRSGIAVPLAVADANLDKLTSVIWDFKPKRVLFLGDLFHSEFNRQWVAFCEVLEQFQTISFELIAGNHDILDPSFYEQAGLKVHLNGLPYKPFLLTHHPLEDLSDDGWYNLAGHIHPGVRLQGNGRQRLKLPCFFFGRHQGLLPAFGEFTGLATLSVVPEDKVFVIVEDEVVRVG